MLIGVFIPIGERRKQTVISDEWINQMWCARAGEHYSTLKKKEILTNAASQVDASVCLLLFRSGEAPKVFKFMETGSQ